MSAPVGDGAQRGAGVKNARLCKERHLRHKPTVAATVYPDAVRIDAHVVGKVVCRVDLVIEVLASHMPVYPRPPIPAPVASRAWPCRSMSRTV